MTKKKLVTREDVCYVCGEPIGVIVYDDRKEKYRSKKNTVVCSGSLCPKCKKMVDYGGIFFIEVKDGSNGLENPYRTGRVICIQESDVKKVLENYQPVNLVEEWLFSVMFPKYEKINEDPQVSGRYLSLRATCARSATSLRNWSNRPRYTVPTSDFSTGARRVTHTSGATRGL